MRQPQKKRSSEFSLPKKILFYAITISIPFLFLLAVEGILRSTNYKGNLDLFKGIDVYGTNYMIPNPNFTARYFFYTKTIPTPSQDAFLKEKPDNGFRIFTIGGSSAAGYPYGYNAMFSRVVQDILADAMPDKTVEVVNVATSAINTYTLYDQVDEILQYEPDAILMYAGHNEFYGALGVGSNENLGAFPVFVRAYLKLQQFKTFLLLRTVIVESTSWVASLFNDNQDRESGTLMKRIVSERSIPYKSDTYQMAMNQFESNTRKIISLFSDKKIPVYVGSVMSNLRNHAPFESINEGRYPPADEVFKQAGTLLESGDSTKALEQFTLAKDLDALKFRAPSDINKLIEQICRSTSAYYVSSKEVLSKNAKNGIPGDDLFLEHLHPNEDGYFLIGKVFSEDLIDHMSDDMFEGRPENLESYRGKRYLSEYDNRVAWHRVRVLKYSWPFVKAGEEPPEKVMYEPKNAADSLAFLTVNESLTWEKAKVQLGGFYESKGLDEKALYEYEGLIRNQPWNHSPYLYAARLLLKHNKLNRAKPYLEAAYKINPENAYANKMLGAIAVNNGNLDKAIELLETAKTMIPDDPQMLYNLSGAYGLKKEFERAQKVLDELKKIDPDFPGVKSWQQQLNNVRANK